MPEEASRRGRLSLAVENLPPAYFALVMATGIVSIACHFVLSEVVAVALFRISLVAYGVLWGLMLYRVARHGRKVAADFADHARGPGFFTWPAGTCVLGSQFVILRSQTGPATALWFLGIALWAVVTYGFLAAVTIRAKKPPLDVGFNGTWLIAVVAMQSVAVLGCLVAPSFSDPRSVVFVSIAMHLGGFMLYLPLIALLLYRWTFMDFSPQQLTPPYWINMGALAISTLAGARLLQSPIDLPLLHRLAPFLAGSTFFLWAAATWWIPLLAVLGFWRHVLRRVPLGYDPQYWGMVFPIGMYATCTVQMSKALELPRLSIVASVFVWPAVVAWLATSAGLVLRIASGPASRA